MRAHLYVALVVMAPLAPLAACSGRHASSTHPELVSAAKARLDAESRGQAAGDPALASSLSTGDAAAADQFSASRVAGQIAAGDPIDYAFDTLSVTAYPLDAGTTDFIAFATLRGHAGGETSREVELYHRDTASGPWKAGAKAYFNANIDLPKLKLDTKGRAHLLAEAEMPAQRALPSDIANRYASAMNEGGASGRLKSGTFAPSQATTGVIESATTFLSSAFEHGTGSVHWDTRPGGRAVGLTDGVLVFASVQQAKIIHANIEGTKTYFFTQGPKRLNYGGLLAPGYYSDISQSSLVSIAVVVGRQNPPDVVALDSTQTAVTGVVQALA